MAYLLHFGNVRAERMGEMISEKHQVSNIILNRWKLKKKKKGGKKRK